MKKIYISPMSETENVNMESIIAVSGGLTTTIDGTQGPGFGGLGNASDDPDVKAFIFEEEPFK